jgi:molybdopterin-guanine dinucleotide biosynthesis protein A
MSIVDRLIVTARSAFPSSQVVLVGAHAAYVGVGVRMLADDPVGVGPLGGLKSLLVDAGDRDAIALACDLPYVTAALLARLAEDAADYGAVAPQVDGLWQPLCARYRPSACLPILVELLKSRKYGLHRIFDALGDRALPLPLNREESLELRDWDTPDAITP